MAFLKIGVKRQGFPFMSINPPGAKSATIYCERKVYDELSAVQTAFR